MAESHDWSDEELLALPLEPALQELGESKSLPAFAIALCVLRYDEVGTVFRGILEEASEGRDLDGNEALFFFRSLHIIGYRRDSRAFEPLLQIPAAAAAAKSKICWATRSTETLSQIVAGVFDGNVDALLDAAVDMTLDETVRDALIGAGTFLTSQGLIPRQRFVEFLQRFHAERLAPDGDMGWFGWMNAIGLLGLRDMQPAVLAAHEARCTGEDMVGARILRKPTSRPRSGRPRTPRATRQCPSAISTTSLVALERFDTGGDGEFMSPAITGRLPEPDNVPVKNPWRDVGRNDPCPCGSGKKAKRCCLKA